MSAVTTPTTDTERQERLQRIRIGATGLAAVFLVVASAGVLTSSASDETPVAQQADVETASGLPDIVGNQLANETLPQEPLAELGVAPSTASGGNAAAAREADLRRTDR